MRFISDDYSYSEYVQIIFNASILHRKIDLYLPFLYFYHISKYTGYVQHHQLTLFVGKKISYNIKKVLL